MIKQLRDKDEYVGSCASHVREKKRNVRKRKESREEKNNWEEFEGTRLMVIVNIRNGHPDSTTIGRRSREVGVDGISLFLATVGANCQRLIRVRQSMFESIGFIHFPTPRLRFVWASVSVRLTISTTSINPPHSPLILRQYFAVRKLV